MQLPSLTLILSCIFGAWVIHSMWSLSLLFSSLKCSEKVCYTSYLAKSPKLQLALFTSVSPQPQSSADVTQIASIKNFNYREPLERFVAVIQFLICGKPHPFGDFFFISFFLCVQRIEYSIAK